LGECSNRTSCLGDEERRAKGFLNSLPNLVAPDFPTKEQTVACGIKVCMHETNPIGQRTERRAEGAVDGRLRTLNDVCVGQ
jgi:hypothetical protein